MSALPLKADMLSVSIDVRLSANSGHWRLPVHWDRDPTLDRRGGSPTDDRNLIPPKRRRNFRKPIFPRSLALRRSREGPDYDNFLLSLERGNLMNYSDQSSVTKQGSRKFPRSPLAVTAAALIAVGALGLALGQDMRFASAEPAQPAQTVQTSLGTAPLGFADVVQKVTPAVVSIQVKGESEVAENDMQIPGLPDLPGGQSPLQVLQAVQKASRPGSAKRQGRTRRIRIR